ncbi:MAG: alpha/beta fold hydrolase [Bdellovibrionaceae bacterium]|nr:alpha/beta fold hydrolase [Pseudobdellovibrionaceae bacterium]
MKLICGLHGFLGDPSDFDLWANQLGLDTENCYFPGLLDSKTPLKPNKCLQEWAESFNDCISDNFKQTEKTLIGYSLGGRLALHALLDNPDMWDRVILLSTNPGLLTYEEKKTRMIQDKKWAQRFTNEPLREVLNAWNEQPVLAGSSPIQHSATLEATMRFFPKILENWSLARQEIAAQDLKSVDYKIQWIMGKEDEKFISILNNLKSMNLAKNSYVHPSCGHRLLQCEAVPGSVTV